MREQRARLGGVAAGERQQIAPGGARRRRDAGDAAQGGRQVGQRDGARHAHVLGQRPGPVQDQRHVEQLVVERVAVLVAAVVEELLAVVGGDDERRAPVEPALGEPGDQPPDLGVGEGDLAAVERPRAPDQPRGQLEAPLAHAHHVLARREDEALVLPVEALGEAPPPGLGRRVDRVRVEVVHEQEERLVPVLVDPAQGGVGDLVGVARVAVVGRVTLVERGEVAGRAEARGEEQHADDGVGAVARRGEQPRQGGDALHERRVGPEPPAGPVLLGVQAGQDRRHRRQGPGRLGEGALEQHPASSQGVEVGGRVALPAVAAELVRAQRVADDEHDVGRLRTAAGRGQGQGGREAGAQRRVAPRRRQWGILARDDPRSLPAAPGGA